MIISSHDEPVESSLFILIPPEQPNSPIKLFRISKNYNNSAKNRRAHLPVGLEECIPRGAAKISSSK